MLSPAAQKLCASFIYSLCLRPCFQKLCLKMKAGYIKLPAEDECSLSL